MLVYTVVSDESLTLTVVSCTIQAYILHDVYTASCCKLLLEASMQSCHGAVKPCTAALAADPHMQITNHGMTKFLHQMMLRPTYVWHHMHEGQ